MGARFVTWVLGFATYYAIANQSWIGLLMALFLAIVWVARPVEL